jgi:SAM-dependent methyltransferase
MRYGLIPTRLAERFAVWFGRVPVPIGDCLLPLLQTRSLMAAVRLGVVDALGRRETAAADVARSCGLDPDAVEMLLRVLVSARYVSMRTEPARHSGPAQTRYRLSPLGVRTLLPGGALDARGYVQWNYVQWDLIEKLENLLRTGRGIDFHETLRGAENWHWYQQAMLDLARVAAPVLADLVPVKAGARTLLDVGGSHGLLGAAICRRHPPMRSVVLEVPEALDEARAAARKAGVDEIVEHRAGNVLEDALPGGADVVLLANVIHHFTRDQAIEVLAKVRDAATPGGTVAVWDFDRPAPDAAPELAADASALYFRLTSASQVVPGDEYGRWLREAGFGDVKVKRSVLAPVQVLAVGVKK